MKNIFYAAAAVPLLALFFADAAGARTAVNETDAAIYFNAATEKYIQGDLESAADNVEKALSFAPGDSKLAVFAAKIFYETAQDAHNARNYKKAFAYLEKARNYDPSNARINDLYEVTKNIMERAAPAPSRPPSREIREVRPADSAGRPAGGVPAATPAAASPDPVLDGDAAVVLSMKLYFAMASVCALLFVNIVAVILLVRRTKKDSRRLAAAAGKHDELRSALAASAAELDKTKELLKYEKESSAGLSRELKEEKSIKNRHYEEQLRLGLDIRQKQLEELFKSGVMASANRSISAIHGARAKVLELIGDATYIDEDSSAALEAARERIAAQARELYESSKSGCMTFLREMTSNANPLIRANIAKALARLVAPDTLEMLVELWRDPAPKVKREALRELKNLRDAVRRGAVKLDATGAARLKEAVDEALSSAEWIF